MPFAPAAKAIIVISTVAVAAGVALYESEHAREEIREWWKDLRTKTTEAWSDLLQELSERFNLTPEEKRQRAREIMIIGGSASASGTAENNAPINAEERARRRRELFKLAKTRGLSSGVDEVPERAVRAATILNESTALRRRNQLGPFVEGSHETGVIVAPPVPILHDASSEIDNEAIRRDGTMAAAAAAAAAVSQENVSKMAEQEQSVDADDASSTTASFSHIHTPTLSEFGDESETEFESAFSGRHSASPLIRSGAPSNATASDFADDRSDTGTEILGTEQESLMDEVRSVSSVTSERSAWSTVSSAEH